MKYIKLFESFFELSKDKIYGLNNRVEELNSDELFKKYNLNNLSQYKRNFESLYVEEDFNKIISILEDKCGEFLNELKNKKQYPIFRGADYVVKNADKGIFYKNSYENRRSLDTDVLISEMFDELFYNKFGTKIRGSGIFTTKIIGTADNYGKTYIFFPFDGYKYFSNIKVIDLYKVVSHKKWSNELINTKVNYEYDYSKPYSKYEGGLGKWVVNDTSEEYDRLIDLINTERFEEFKQNLEMGGFILPLKDRNIYHEVKWVPSITYEEYEKKVIEEAEEILSYIVSGYKDNNIEDVVKEEMSFLTKSYCLIDISFLPNLIEYLCITD